MFVDVVDDVIWLVVRSICSVCEVEREVEVADNLHVVLDDDLEAIFFEDFLKFFLSLFCLRAAYIFEDGKTIVSVQPNVFLVVPVGDDR